MLILWILCTVTTAIVGLLYWLSKSSACIWSYEDLSNKAVIITGCDVSQIALEVALLLDKKGVPVFACCSSETNADRLRRRSASSKLQTLILDPKDRKRLQELVNTVKSLLPPSSVLWGIVNAAVENRAAGLPAEMYSVDDDYRPLLETNLLNTAAVTSAFMPLLINSRGRVVNTGCVSGLLNVPANAAYGVSMSALVSWSESLRREKVAVGVTVSTVIPGAVKGIQGERDRIWSQLKSRYYAASDELHNLYTLDEYMTSVGRALLRSENRPKLSPEVVAQAYAHALFSRCPRRLYLVGSDARLAGIISCLPRWIQDFVLPFIFHHPKPPGHTRLQSTSSSSSA